MVLCYCWKWFLILCDPKIKPDRAFKLEFQPVPSPMKWRLEKVWFRHPQIQQLFTSKPKKTGFWGFQFYLFRFSLFLQFIFPETEIKTFFFQICFYLWDNRLSADHYRPIFEPSFFFFASESQQFRSPELEFTLSRQTIWSCSNELNGTFCACVNVLSVSWHLPWKKIIQQLCRTSS